MSTRNWNIRDDENDGQHVEGNSTHEMGGGYGGVFNHAYQQGIKSIITTLLQAPSDENKMTAIFHAEVVMESGCKFTATGDASPESVDAEFLPHFIRVAETRAKARALSDAINRWVIPVEELMHGVIRRPNGHPNGNGMKPVQHPQGKAYNGGSKPITMNQLNRLTKLLEARGYLGGAIDEWLCRACNVEQVGDITRRQASSMISQLEQQS